MSLAFRRLLRTDVCWPLLGLLLLLAPASTTSAASRLDPRFRFRTLTTAHFQIHFHQGEDALAARLAVIAEEVWPRVGGALGVDAPRRTHVIVGDQSELANGWATPFPYNTIFVTAAAPSGAEFIGRTEDWLRLVFTHEFTHIVQLDRSRGWARLLRGVFGRTPVAFPNVFLPGWAVEGLAVWQESAVPGAGRRYAGDFRAIEFEAGRAGLVEPLDRVNGPLVDWPSGSAPYAYGLGFHQYLATQYGEERFARLYAATAGRVPFLGTGAFNSIYGRSLGQLYTDYSRSLAEPSGPPRERTQAMRLTRHGFTVLGPRFAPPACDSCSAEIWYSVRNPHGLPALRAVEIDGDNDRHIVTRYLGSTQAATARFVVFDEQEVRRNVGVYSDLRLIDRGNGDVRALTHEQRVRDPDLSPDERTIVAVREGRGQRDLVIFSFDGKEVGPAETLLAGAETRFDAPRWSPDGRTIAVARQSIDRLSEIVVVDPATRDIRVIASSPQTRFVTPTWHPSGGAIVAAADFDGGPFDLYEFPLAAGFGTRRLTTTAGAIWPDVSPDGRTLAYAGYSTDGFDVFITAYAPGANVAMASADLGAIPSVDVPSTSNRLPSAATPVADRTPEYRPFATLLPTSWNPIVEIDEGVRAGLNVFGTDVLARHAYSATATWLIEAPAGSLESTTLEPDWRLGYVYDRWRPVLFAAASRSTFFFTGTSPATDRLTSFTLKEVELEGGVLFPVRHVRSSHRLLTSVVRTLDRYSQPAGIASRQRTAIRAAAASHSTRFYGYSISPEHGLSAAAMGEVVRRGLGADINATVITGDVRAYVPGLGRRHVLALRASGGRINQPLDARLSFATGGAAANPDVLDFGRDQLAPLRGFPSTVAGDTRVAAASVDYRFPLARPQRGRGTWPIFLQNLHGALFADTVAAGNQRLQWSDAPFSVGGELSWDLVLGYSYPLTATIGGAWGHDRTELRNRAAVFVRIGRAF